MLEVGRLSSYELNRAHFGAWAIMSSPLILGIDLRLNDTLRSVWDIVVRSNSNGSAVPYTVCIVDPFTWIVLLTSGMRGLLVECLSK